MSITLTVFFDGQFWCALFEQRDMGKLCTARLVLGAEPKHAQLEAIVIHDYGHLRFSPSIADDVPPPLAVNPKRRQRQIARAQQPGIGTKAQQALKLSRESAKQAVLSRAKAQREAEKQRQFCLRQEKKKAKHRGH